MAQTQNKPRHDDRIYMKMKQTKQGDDYFVGKLNDKWINAFPTEEGQLKFKYDDEVVDAQLGEGQYGPYYKLRINNETYLASEGSGEWGPYITVKVPKVKSGSPSSAGGSSGGNRPKSTYSGAPKARTTYAKKSEV